MKKKKSYRNEKKIFYINILFTAISLLAFFLLANSTSYDKTVYMLIICAFHLFFIAFFLFNRFLYFVISALLSLSFLVVCLKQLKIKNVTRNISAIFNSYNSNPPSETPHRVLNMNVLIDIDFDKEGFNQIPIREIYNDKAQIITDSVTFNNKKSVRFEVDVHNYLGEKGIRSEFAFASETHPERWYGLSIFAPQSYLPDPEPEIVTQWHNNPDFKLAEGWLSPSLSMWVQNGHWITRTLWDTSRVTFQNMWQGQTAADLGPVEIGKWTNWVFHIKFSYKNDGLTEVYKNGKRVYLREGPNSFNDEQLPYWKVGIYKWVYKNHGIRSHKYNRRVLYYNNIKKGNEHASLKDVSP